MEKRELHAGLASIARVPRTGVSGTQYLIIPHSESTIPLRVKSRAMRRSSGQSPGTRYLLIAHSGEAIPNHPAFRGHAPASREGVRHAEFSARAKRVKSPQVRAAPLLPVIPAGAAEQGSDAQSRDPETRSQRRTSRPWVPALARGLGREDRRQRLGRDDREERARPG